MKFPLNEKHIPRIIQLIGILFILGTFFLDDDYIHTLFIGALLIVFGVFLNYLLKKTQ